MRSSFPCQRPAEHLRILGEQRHHRANAVPDKITATRRDIDFTFVVSQSQQGVPVVPFQRLPFLSRKSIHFAPMILIEAALSVSIAARSASVAP